MGHGILTETSQRAVPTSIVSKIISILVGDPQEIGEAKTSKRYR